MDEQVSLPVDEDQALTQIAAEGWAPRDDAEAERALRLLERLAAKYVAVKAQAAAWRSEIDVWERGEVGRVSGPATAAVLGLEGFALAVRRQGGPKTLRYPSGVIETRAGRDRIVVTDEAALLAWAKVNAPDAVKVVESVLVSKLPGEIVDGRLVLGETSEIVPGVQIQSGANYASATVKLASQRELPRGS